MTNGGRTLVAVGYLARDFRAAAWFSTDGLVWAEASDFPSDELSRATAVAAGPAGFVSAGESGTDAAIWVSADGRAWHRVIQPAFHDATQIRMTAVVAWGHGFVAGGYVGSLVGPIRAAFWTSRDGETWTRVADDAGFAATRVTGLAVAPDGSRLVAVGAAGDAKAATGSVAWQSLDGETWQRAADGPVFAGTLMNAVTAGDDGFVAVGSSVAADRAAAWRSADGLTWTASEDALALDNFGLKIEMRDVAWTGSTYLAGGHFLFGSQGKIQGVAAGGPGLLAVGSYGSPDFSIPTVWISPPP